MATTTRWSLGLGGSDHDFAAALMQGTDIRVAIEQERLTRAKNGLTAWYREPLGPAVDYCLQAEGIDLDEVATIAASDTIPARTRAAFARHPLRLFSHHLCHAAAAYMMLPATSRAAILVYDGYGSILGEAADGLTAERETMSFYVFDEEVRHLGTTTGPGYRETDDYPIGVGNSVGMLYEIATEVIGYGAMDAGKTMGLAAYGVPRHAEDLLTFVTLGSSFSDCFSCPTEHGEIVAFMERALMAGGAGTTARADLASSVQEVVHRVLRHAIDLLAPYGVDYLALSGGCALNGVANGMLAAASPGGLPLMIPPHCGDAGLGLGALWLAAREETGISPSLTFRGAHPAPALARPGRLYDRDEVRRAATASYPRLSFDPSVSSPAELAARLAAGDIVGVVNGRSEIGPRALGGRSILADPRSIETRERINREIKHREPFRPLAPVILSADYADWFEDPRQADAYMLKVAVGTDRCRRQAPAVLHVDGTARVQLVDDESDPWLVGVLTAFRDLTGVPLLVNTSFNRRGEPIVESPADAVDAFLGMGLDGLYMDGSFYRAGKGREHR